MPDTPGIGGAYRYNPDTDRLELIHHTRDATSDAPHPLAAPAPAVSEAERPVPVAAKPARKDPAPAAPIDPT